MIANETEVEGSSCDAAVLGSEGKMAMSAMSVILDFNRAFVRRKDYLPFRANRLPRKKMVILTCMDTRLTELLPRAMNLRNGDVKMIKTAGAIVSHPFDSVMRSIIVAVHELKAREVLVVGHHDCGMAGLKGLSLLEKARRRGISGDVLRTLNDAGIDLERWLTGFDDVRDSVVHSVQMIRHHPLVPKAVLVHGMLIHPETGKLDVVVDGQARGA